MWVLPRLFAAICGSVLCIEDSVLSSAEERPTVGFLQLGRPELISDLQEHALQCRVVPLPDFENVLVVASAVSLAGSPRLHGGWEAVPPDFASGDSGFHILSQTVRRKDGDYYVCFTTWSRQGCDFVLTVVATNVTQPVAPVWLKTGYPSVWSLSSDFHNQLQFLIEVDELEDVRISAVPISGDVGLEVFASECGGQSLATSAVEGPDVLDLPHPLRKGLPPLLCIQVTGEGTFSLTAGPRALGTFLVPALPAAGMLDAGDACEHFRLLANSGTDLTITATAEDGSELAVSALAQHASATWTQERPLGGSGAVLVLEHNDVVPTDDFTETSFFVNVCRPQDMKDLSSKAIERVLFWVTAVSDTSVTTLEDGLSLPVTVPRERPSDLKGDLVYREFKFLVPGGSDTPREITLSATSVRTILLAADTQRFPHNPEAYRWVVSNLTNPVVRLTTEPDLVSDEVHLLDCRLPCFVYFSTYLTPLEHGNVSLEVAAVTDKTEMLALVDGEELEETLAGGESQTFRYVLRRTDTPIILSVSVAEGNARFQVSASPDFPDTSITTRSAKDVIMLGVDNAEYLAAVRNAAASTHPVLYLKATAEGQASTAFTVLGRMQGEPVTLKNGQETRGGLVAGQFDAFRFYLGSALDERPLNATVELSPITGNPSFYVSCHAADPDADHYDWAGGESGQEKDVVVLSTKDKAFADCDPALDGWVYVRVIGDTLAAFAIEARWGRATATLSDGYSSFGQVALDERVPYSFELVNRAEGKPFAVRAQVSLGAINLCVWKADNSFRACAVADARSSSGLVDLAALDVPVSQTRLGAQFKMEIMGLAEQSEYRLRALVNEPAIIIEGQELVDTFGPPCCIPPDQAPLLQRQYRSYVHPVPHARVVVTSIGDGDMSGAKVTVEGRVSQTGKWSDPVTGKAPPNTTDTFTFDVMDLQRWAVDASGIWVQITLSVPRPVNFTMHFETVSGGEDGTAPVELFPAEPYLGTLSDRQAGKFSFTLPAKDSLGEPWRLIVNECYGHASVLLNNSGILKTVDGQLEIPLPSSKEVTTGILSIAPSTEPPVQYEVVLLPPGSSEDVIQMPVDTTLYGLKANHSVVFNHASVNTMSPRWSQLSAESNTMFAYTLVAVPKNETQLSSRSVCGLMEALKHKSVLRTTTSESFDRTVTVPLPSNVSESYVVNVLVQMRSGSDDIVAAAAYSLADLATPLKEYSEASWINLKLLVLILTAAAVSWWCCCYQGASSNQSKPRNEEGMSFELEANYGLYNEVKVKGKGGQYLPPGMSGFDR